MSSQNHTTNMNMEITSTRKLAKLKPPSKSIVASYFHDLLFTILVPNRMLNNSYVHNVVGYCTLVHSAISRCSIASAFWWHTIAFRTCLIVADCDRPSLMR